MKLVIDTNLSAKAGDFGETGKTGTFHLPAAYIPVVKQLRATTVETLYEASINERFVVQSMLDWSDSEFEQAIAELRGEIAKSRPNYFKHKLKPMKSFSFGYNPRD